ncbi:MAG: type II toxin-antitoxin system Phd/YefM family antitoxin [Anaerolineae bacterium]|nr:type II toxin-antitoxin system Phd/YefM family antitoxin [Anaerolineae bacterium]NUQ05757.1 type II toxin-antitoxin system Phd/YefM family antitoxin [Anaerolineae bacterium]
MQHPKQSTVAATEVRRNFGEVIRRVSSGREHLIVEKDGLPVVAILSMSAYEKLLRGKEEQEIQRAARVQSFDAAARAAADEIAKGGLSDDELEAQFEPARKRSHTLR